MLGNLDNNIHGNKNSVQFSQMYAIYCMIIVIFLGRFRIFENRPLDPVFDFLTMCESKLVKKKAKN